jgi:hypothetical protein
MARVPPATKESLPQPLRVLVPASYRFGNCAWRPLLSRNRSTRFCGKDHNSHDDCWQIVLHEHAALGDSLL